MFFFITYYASYSIPSSLMFTWLHSVKFTNTVHTYTRNLLIFLYSPGGSKPLAITFYFVLVLWFEKCQNPFLPWRLFCILHQIFSAQQSQLLFCQAESALNRSFQIQFSLFWDFDQTDADISAWPWGLDLFYFSCLYRVLLVHLF